MKKLILSVIILTFAFISADAQVPTYIPSDGLQAWYPFNSNANDESGNGHNGIVNGAVLTTDRYGNNNKAYSFDGTTNNINIGQIYSATASYSIWFYAVNLSAPYKVLLGRWEGASSKLSLEISGRPNNAVSAVSSTDGSNAYECQSTTILQTGQWYHLVATFDTDSCKIYLNDTLENTIAEQGGLFDNGDVIYIGATRNGTSNSYNWFGTIDDVAIWNRAITASEVHQVFEGGCANPPVAQITPAGNVSFCSEGKLNGHNDSAITYQWFMDYDSIPGAVDSVYITTQPGVYTVEIASAVCSSISDPVTVNFSPQVFLGNDTVLSCPDSILLDAGNGFISYAWSTNDSTQTLLVTTAGTYYVTSTTADGCTATDTIVVSYSNMHGWYRDVDGDGYGAGSATIYTCNQPAGYAFMNGDCDDYNAAIHPGALDIPDNGIDEDCNGADSKSTEIKVIDALTSLRVYPNPGRDRIIIQFNDNNRTVINVRIYSVVSSLIEEHDYAKDDRGEYQISVQHLVDGLYFIHIADGTRQYIVKWIKQ